MNTTRKEETRTRLAYFLRYFAVFSIPVLLLGCLLWANNLWYTYRETASLRNATLLQMVESLDLLVDQTQAVAEKTSANGEITAALRDSDDDALRISQWMGLYEDLFVEDIALAYYISGDTNIITRDGVIPYSAFENTYADMQNFSLAGFFRTLNQSTRFTTSNLYRDSTSHLAIAFTYPVTGQRARPVGTICFLIPNAALQGVFGKYFPEDSATLYVLDALNQPAYASGGDITKARTLARHSGVGLVDQQGGDILLRAVSKQGQFTYYVAMPRVDLYASASRDMGFLFALQAVLVLFSAAVAVSLTSRHYANMQTVQRSNLSLKNEIVEQDDIIRTLVLRKLLDGSRKNPTETDYNLRCANIQYYHPHFFVLVADLAATADEDVESLAFAALFDGKSSNETYYQYVSRPENKQAVLIVNTVHEQDALRQEAAALMGAAPPAFPVGLSGKHTSLLSLNNAYIEAVVAINERLHAQGDQLFLFADIAEDIRDSTLPTLERSLIQESIRNNNRELIARSVDAIFEKITAETMHPQIVTCACYDVVNLCIRLFSLFDVPLSSQKVMALSDFHAPQALCATVKTTLGDLCAIVQEKTSRSLTSTKYNLIGFVQAHFRDSNLSLALLAEEFHLSQSYISKLFKDETGQTFISYVKQLRMSYVKKQLMDTDLQVKDIILDTGYVDVANFARTFRQEEGVTPLQYRRNIRQNG